MKTYTKWFITCQFNYINHFFVSYSNGVDVDYELCYDFDIFLAACLGKSWPFQPTLALVTRWFWCKREVVMIPLLAG